MSAREANIKRKTNETDISLTFAIDGDGTSSISTGVGFFDHMLDLFAKHGLFNLDLSVKGDLQIDAHHSVEDVGICLGQAFAKALGDGKSIRRFASVITPMDESLCQMAIDVSNRAFLGFNDYFNKEKDKQTGQSLGDCFNSTADLWFDIFSYVGRDRKPK